MDLSSQSDYLKLKAEIFPDRTRHVEYISTDNSHRPRKVTRDWLQVRELGSGGNGVVWLERANDGALRAVKQLQKSKNVSSYLQELLTMTKLSKVITLCSSIYAWLDSRMLIIWLSGQRLFCASAWMVRV